MTQEYRPLSPVPDIPKTGLQISDDVISELNIQAKGYIAVGLSIKTAQKMAINALAEFGSEKVFVVPTTPEMIEAGDFGFRLKEKTDDPIS